MSNEEIGRTAAEALRRDLDLGIDPIANLARLIEQKVGIGVAYVRTRAAAGHGLTMRLGDRSLLSVGCTEHPLRLQSTLAHELGHVRLGSVSRSLGHSGWDERTPEEIQADSFSRHFLVPLEAVEAATSEAAATTALLSDLVQRYLASPQIVAIQLREVGAIDSDTCRQWSALTAGRLASQFGWRSEYQSLVTQTNTPRAPQALLARAIVGYRWNLVTPATIARLDGTRDPRQVAERLAEEGIVPLVNDNTISKRPTEVGVGLTPEELAVLQGDSD